MGRRSVGFETAFATIGVVGLVFGAALPGPDALRIGMVITGIVSVACVFYEIFSGLALQRRYYDDEPDGDPDGDGEPILDERHVEVTTMGDSRRRFVTVVPFPRKVA